MWDTIQRWHKIVLRGATASHDHTINTPDAMAALFIAGWQLCDYFDASNQTVPASARDEISGIRNGRDTGTSIIFLLADFSDTYKHGGRNKPDHGVAWIQTMETTRTVKGMSVRLGVQWDRPGAGTSVEQDGYWLADQVIAFWTDFLARHQLT